MNIASLESILPHVAERLGWTLLHSLWQGLLILAALIVALGALRRRSAAARHAACLLALLALVGALAITLWRTTPSPLGSPRRTAGSAASSAFPAAPTARTAVHAPQLPGIQAPSPLAPPAAAPDPLATPRWHARLDRALPWLTTFWALGVLLLSLRHVGGWRRVRALRRRSIPARPGPQRALLDLCVTFRLHAGAIRLLESASCGVPILTGLLRPVVVLPAQAVTGLSAAELEAILAHELAHLVRRDTWTNLALVLVETVLFYHPAVWWIASRVRAERELAADDLALRVCADRRIYAGALVRLAEFQQPIPAFALASTGGGGRRSLLHRVRRILRPTGLLPAEPVAWTLLLPALAAAVLGLLWITQVHAAEPTPSPQSTPTAPAPAAPTAAPTPSAPPITAQDVEDVRVARLLAANRRAARTRAEQDRRFYTAEQLQEIETLYQVANHKGLHNDESRASLKQLLDKYDKANRTGCATLYYGQGSTGTERVEYLTRAVEKFSDCYYFNGCRVGGYARIVLAETLWINGEKDKARALLVELKTHYQDATGHDGRPILEEVAAMEKAWAAQ